MIWVVVAIVVILVIALLLLVGAYNRLVRYRNAAVNAWAQIGVQLKRRHDLIPNLVETVKGYAAHERGVFDEVTAARAQAQQARTPAESAQAEGILSQALGRLFAVAEAYPDLKASQNFRELQAQLAGTENEIAASRENYNNAVLQYNNAIQTFPGAMLAGPFGFREREFFQVETQAEREPPRVDFGTSAAAAAATPAPTSAEPAAPAQEAPRESS